MKRLEGLFAAVPTPLNADGSVNLAAVSPMVEHLLADGVQGLYVNGSTGEGVSLTTDERQSLAAEFVTASAGRLPVIVQVGHNSIAEAKKLSAHAAATGADAISATPPCYFKPSGTENLIACLAEIAGVAPELPFYYYHIPVMTGVRVEVSELMPAAAAQIPNFAGAKFSDPDVPSFQECVELEGGRYDMFWGSDQMLLSALVVGARGAVGSTYNVAAPLSLRIMSALREGNVIEARRLQSLSVEFVRTMLGFPFHSALKELMGTLGIPCGPCRLPLPTMDAEQTEALDAALRGIGFFDWARNADASIPADAAGGVPLDAPLAEGHVS